MAFTTWAALKSKLLDDLESGAWKYKSYSIGGRTTTYSSFSEFKELLDFVEKKAAEEAGTFSARVYAKQGGRASTVEDD